MNYVLKSLGIFLLVSSGTLQAAEVMAKKDGVPVYAEASNRSTVVIKLKAGQAVQSNERKGMFWQVKLSNGAIGYVSVLAVNRQANENDSSFAKAVRAGANKGREGSEVNALRSRSSVMGVRGLDESEESASAGNVTPNLRVVYAMEDRHVSEKKLQALGAAVTSEIEHKLKKRQEE